MKKLLLVAAIAAILPACATYEALSQPGPADLEGIGVGTSRQSIISKLGSPKVTETVAGGDKQDIFEFQSGYNQASKLRVIPYIAADVFSAFLSELIFWPLELTAMKEATCTGIAIYDSQLKAKTWNVMAKDDASAQDC